MITPNELCNRLIGAAELDAMDEIAMADCVPRILINDDEYIFHIDDDYMYNRINLYIRGGLVYKADVG